MTDGFNRRRLLTTGLGLAASGVAGLLSACSSADKRDPTPLEDFNPKLVFTPLWQRKLGAVSFPLQNTVRAGRCHVANDAGWVQALDLASGEPVWQAELGAAVSAGVGSDGRYAALVSRDNELMVLDQGTVLWRRRLDGAVLTAPLVAGERVFVLAVDRSVHAWDVLDGRYLWALRRQGDPLTLAEAGVLLPYQDTLLVGQGPRLVAVDPLRGIVRWETTVSNPRGTNEVERLADLVGPALRQGDSLCARAFQNGLGCVDLRGRRSEWSQPGGGTRAVVADADFLFAADGSDRLSARRRGGGELVWSSERLLYRRLSAPALIGPAVVWGDLEGWLHVLARDSGQTLMRLPTDGSAIVQAPVVVDNTLLAVTRAGGLFAFRLT